MSEAAIFRPQSFDLGLLSRGHPKPQAGIDAGLHDQ
jgi:hypothetical protein